MNDGFHLAEVNVALMRAPLDHPLMAEFAEALATVNAAADTSPGFVWRLQTEAGDATGVRAYDDPRILFNLSVWQSLGTLRDYAYRSMHGVFYARRQAWFEKMDPAHLALWWVPSGHRPTVVEARDRLEHLRTHGPTPHAFTFNRVTCRPAGSVLSV
jgi:Domain of unknown function (DUF3291)